MTSTLAAPRVGHQQPRVRHVPPYVSSAGEEAVEFCAQFGLRLDPWQQNVLTHALGERADGRWASFEVAALVPRQNGKGALLEARELAGLFLFEEQLILHSAHEFKALDVATPIFTPRGWSTMGALADGDEVYAPDGQPTKVVAAHPVRHGRPCYAVRFDDGQEVVADEDHLWAVLDSHTGGRQVLTTKQLVDGGISHVAPRTGRQRRTYRYRVDVPAPLDVPAADLPVEPWLLGAWLGDGTSAKGELTVGADELDYITSQLTERGETFAVIPDRRHPKVLTVRIDGLAARLRAAGLLRNKHIPEQYLSASVAQRRALLAGLMDTDGGVCGHRVCITMVKRELMESVLSLVRSLGYKATLREFRARLNGQDAGPMWRVAMTSSQSVSPFFMPRKTAALKPREPKMTRAHYNAIVAVEPVASRPTRCITVAHESSCYLVGRGFVPTHNTAQEAFRRVLFHVENTDWLRKRVKRVRTSHGEEGIELTTGARLRFVARSTGSGRGFSGDTVILDEAYNLASEGMSALLPTLSARPNPQIWYTSSAGMETSDQLRRVRERGITGESKRLAYFEWSAPSEASLDDREAWAQANPALGFRITEEFIESERDAMDDLGFSRERLGIWFDPAAQMVIDGAKWAELADPSSQVEDPVVFGVDANPERTAAAIAVAGRRADGIGHVEIVDSQPGTGWLLRRIVELHERHKPQAWVIDPASAAGSLLPGLEEHGIEPHLVGGREMAQACGALYEDVTEKAAFRHLDQPSLNAALGGAKKRPLGDAWAWHRRRSDVDISPLVAATLAWHGFAKQSAAPQPTSAYDTPDSELMIV